MDSAFETAKNENKHILLIFHTNWCDFCKMLIEGFNNKDSEPFFKESYIITTLNPLDKNHLVNDGAMEYYGELLENDKVGWPSTFIIDKNGNKLDKYYGFPTSDNAIDSLLTVLNTAEKHWSFQPLKPAPCARATGFRPTASTVAEPRR